MLLRDWIGVSRLSTMVKEEPSCQQAKELQSFSIVMGLAHDDPGRMFGGTKVAVNR
jgi:hypothetical protein